MEDEQYTRGDAALDFREEYRIIIKTQHLGATIPATTFVGGRVMSDAISFALVGLQAASAHLNKTAEKIASSVSPDTSDVPASGDSIDISDAAIQLLAARNGFAAGTKLLKVLNEQERRTLDLLA